MNSKSLTRYLLAEFLGTFTLIIFGVAVVAQVILSDKNNGEYFSINVGWGLAVTMGIYVAGGVTGAHLNPAVTLALACWRGFPWAHVVPYVVAQTAAAFVASVVVYYTYFDAVQFYEQAQIDAGEVERVEGARHTMATAGVWATYPSEHLANAPIRGGLVDQIVGTALLVMCIFALSDQDNLAPDNRLAPIAVGMVVLLVGMTFGYNCGYAINPARDFGPRLFTYLWGWGGQVFREGQGFWWVPIVGPCVGGVVGGAVYDLFIRRWHPHAKN